MFLIETWMWSWVVCRIFILNIDARVRYASLVRALVVCYPFNTAISQILTRLWKQLIELSFQVNSVLSFVKYFKSVLSVAIHGSVQVTNNSPQHIQSFKPLKYQEQIIIYHNSHGKHWSYRTFDWSKIQQLPTVIVFNFWKLKLWEEWQIQNSCALNNQHG